MSGVIAKQASMSLRFLKSSAGEFS